MWNVCGMFKGVSEGEYGCMTILDLMACLNGCGVILLKLYDWKTRLCCKLLCCMIGIPWGSI